MRKHPHQAQQGFFTFAQNNTTTDYLAMAYVQAMSVKLAMPGSLYAVAVDKDTLSLITDQHRQVFDYVIEIDEDYAKDDEWKLANEWQAFWLTPFKETIKLEADLLIPADISHWWNGFRLRDVVLSTNCQTYMGTTVTSDTLHRKIFIDNNLPNVYNGLMYFRYSQISNYFFSVARDIYQDWDSVRNTLKNLHNIKPSTDLVYAITAMFVGPEFVTLPTLNFINFVHMKPSLQGWKQDDDWTDSVMTEFDLPIIRINNRNQYHPIHYHQKNFIKKEVVDEYQRRLGIS
jgi:hypothetical protein